ncbi:MAG: hypothetical protein ACREUF_03080, partial [Solimonas sp.]
METDGWYVDLPVQTRAQDAGSQQPPGGCVDQINATQNGDPKVLGFPVSYSMTVTGDDGKPSIVTMEVTELEITNLDAALFEIPAGLKEAGDVRALTQALSDANEAKLTAQITTAPPTVQKTPGVVRIAVAEPTNKTKEGADTRALRARLVAELVEAKVEAAEFAAPQADLLKLATAHGYDYVLTSEITELKVSRGGLGGLLKAASAVSGAGGGKDPTEATLAIKLLQPDGKTRLSNNARGKDGGFDLKTGLGVARFAGTMYMNMMTGRMMMNALNAQMAGNLQGMGMLGNPSLINMQAQGLGMGSGRGMMMGMDPTAGAASFLMQQALAG